MNIGGIICGAIAAVIGAVAWAAIAYYANVELDTLHGESDCWWDLGFRSDLAREALELL